MTDMLAVEEEAASTLEASSEAGAEANPETEISPAEESPKPKRRWGRWLALLLLGGMMVFLVLGLMKAYEQPVSSGMAPDFTLNTYSGETIKLSQFRGQVVIINFWASWCPPCREEAPYL